MIPIFRVRSLDEAVGFYRDLIGFAVHPIDPEIASFYAVLSLGKDELHLTQERERRDCRQSAILRVDDVDAAFQALRDRGFHPPHRRESPVHEAPLDQSWGTREFYIDDPSGNTLCFAAPR